jgi:hypothetical protein
VTSTPNTLQAILGTQKPGTKLPVLVSMAKKAEEPPIGSIKR